MHQSAWHARSTFWGCARLACAPACLQGKGCAAEIAIVSHLHMHHLLLHYNAVHKLHPHASICLEVLVVALCMQASGSRSMAQMAR